MRRRTTANYEERIPNTQAREVMKAMATFAEGQGVDEIPQSWCRNGKYQKRPVPPAVISDLVGAGFLQSSFNHGPVYTILLWPLEVDAVDDKTEDEGT